MLSRIIIVKRIDNAVFTKDRTRSKFGRQFWIPVLFVYGAEAPHSQIYLYSDSQISGRKQVILFEPHTNHKMYEGHIQQATLSYNQHTGEFSRRNLEDSTSMVMSPVDLLKPDFKVSLF